MSSVCPFVCLSVRPLQCQTCGHNILKRNEPILMEIGINGRLGKGIKLSTLGSKVEVTQGQSRSQKIPFGKVSQELSHKLVFNIYFQMSKVFRYSCLTRNMEGSLA